MTDHESTGPHRQRMIALGTAIRELREAAGESKLAAAEAVGLSRIYLRGIEQGERNLSLQRLFDIADHYGVTAASLLKDIR